MLFNLSTGTANAFMIGSHVLSAASAGAIYLAPSTVSQLLNLVIEGLDMDGLLLAARYLPYSTGVTIPDFCESTAFAFHSV
jgi:hypothetical protein